MTPEGSQQGVGMALSRLVDEGIVERQEAGPALLYRLNREHLAAPAIDLLVNLRRELLKRLRQTFAEWQTPPLHVSMFGSAARGDGDARSDIDLFVVRPKKVDVEDAVWRRQLDELADSVRSWTGNHAGVVELSEDDLPSLVRRHPPVLDDLNADAITLVGPDVARVLRGVG